MEEFNIDELVKSRHSGGNRSPDVVPTKVGSHLKDWIPVSPGTLDSGFRRNDGKPHFLAFYQFINIGMVD